MNRRTFATGLAVLAGAVPVLTAVQDATVTEPAIALGFKPLASVFLPAERLPDDTTDAIAYTVRIDSMSVTDGTTGHVAPLSWGCHCEGSVHP